jgi:hypothetical protein
MVATEIDQTTVADVGLTATDVGGLVSTGTFDFGPTVAVPEPFTAADLGAFPRSTGVRGSDAIQVAIPPKMFLGSPSVSPRSCRR